MGVDAVRVLRGPLFADKSGYEKEASVKALILADGRIDGLLRECLADGTILLVKCDWLASEETSDPHLGRDQDGNVIFKRRQELPEEAFFTPAEAAALLDRRDRSMLSLSHCWQTAPHPVSGVGTAAMP